MKNKYKPRFTIFSAAMAFWFAMFVVTVFQSGENFDYLLLSTLFWILDRQEEDRG